MFHVNVRCSWDGLLGGRNCSCVWSFWCSELCSVDQTAAVQRGSVLDVRGPENEWRFLMQCRLRDRRSRLFSLGLRPCPLRTEIPPDSLNLLIMLCTVEGEISKSLPIFLWGTLFLNISIIFSRICWQTGDPRPIFASKGLDLSWMLLLYQIIITITCWHHLFQITSLSNQFTSLLALNCSCPNFFWNVLQVWMTGKDVYLQMTWSWPDKTWNILCSYCLQWNTSQSKFRNHYFLFLFAFSILSQLFLIWGCTW